MTEAAVAEATETVETTSTDTVTSVVSDTKEAVTETAAAGTPETAEVAPFYSSLPDTWRRDTAAAVAGEGASEDEIAKLQNQMERFPSYEAFAKNRFDLQQKLSEGISKSPLPDDASDEQIAEWRASNGVPEAADKYDLDLGEGVTLAGEDKAVIDALLPEAHDLNVSNETMSRLGKKFFEARAAAAEQRQQQDGLDSQKAETALKEHWGADFKANVNIMTSMMQTMPEGLRGRVANSRMPGGAGLMNDPEFVSWAVGLQRQANPTIAVVPSGGGNEIQTIADEVASLEKHMRDEPDSWYKDDAAQKRLRDLYDAQASIEAQNKN